MKRQVALLFLGWVTQAVANPLPSAILSNIADAPSNMIPGRPEAYIAPAVRDRIGRIYPSADGRRWITRVAYLNSPGFPRHAIVTGVGTDRSTIQTILAEGDSAPGDPTRKVAEIYPELSINKGGVYVISARLDGTSNDSLRLYMGSPSLPLTEIVRQGHVPPFDPTVTLTSFESPFLTTGGSIVFITGLRDSTGTTKAAVLIREPSGLLRLHYKEGITIPQGQVSPVRPIRSFGDLTASEHGSKLFYHGTLLGTGGNNYFIARSNVVLRQGQNDFWDVRTLDVSSNGEHWCYSRSGAYVVNGLTVGHTLGSLTGSQSDGVFNDLYQSGIVSVNDFGDYVASDSYGVLALNRSRVIRLQGMKIDVDDDGIADRWEIRGVQPGGFLTNSNKLYVVAEVSVSNTGFGGGIAVALLRVQLPLPGDADDDGEVGPNDFAMLATSFGTSDGDPGFDPRADFQRDDEIGPGDFAVLVKNFGRDNSGD